MIESQVLRSNKWGFTKWDREDYLKGRIDGTLQPDGIGVKYIPNHGRLPDIEA